MTWLDKRKYLDTSGGWLRRDPQAREAPRPAQAVERSYSISEVAALCSVSRRTVWKWLDEDEKSGEAIIPADAWYKLPSGQVRIREWAVKKLQEGT